MDSYPVNDRWQEINDFKIEAPYETRLVTDNTYENKIIYLRTNSGAKISDSPEIILSFKVVRKEINALSDSIIPHKGLSRFLKPDRLLPVNGYLRKIAKNLTKAKATDLERVREIYDYIIDELTYSKDDPKICGIGDSLLTLRYKKGICTDYHSLFISLVRSLGIPAKFEIGFPIPEDKRQGKINGYHCWAKFYLKGKGWIPVDISEADKHPEKRDYFFGNIDENRIHFTTGRDIRLKYTKNTEPLISILLAMAIFLSFSKISFTAEHPGTPAAEHPGKPALTEHKEHPGETHEEEHPGKKETLSAKQIIKSIKDHIKSVTDTNNGYYPLYDSVEGKQLRLRLIKVHEDRVSYIKKDDAYFACTDFKSEDGIRYDVDFWMKLDSKGKLTVYQTKIHKKDGKPRFIYKEDEIATVH